MEKISVRLQTPITDENPVRKDIHIVTSSDEVIVDKGDGDSKTLTEVLGEINGIQLQTAKPNFPCLWAKPLD